MKKAHVSCFTASILTWAISTISYSQGQNSAAKPGSAHEEFISASKRIYAAKDSNTVLLNELNIKAIRSFMREYKNVSDAKWVMLDKGFSVVYFTVDSIQTSVLYNSRGLCEWVRRDYSEDKLPRDVRHLVKRTYYDFSIYCVNEVTMNRLTAYIVALEDKMSWKIIKVIDGEMEIMREYTKG
ncbi:MAG TPA: hypothetical protein VI461_07230 [Chitinophagaceae bacterium]|nr:hypothetical protein [Chitinophagaceae bacterium]